MEHLDQRNDGCGRGEIVDFDEAVLDACPVRDRGELRKQAELLAIGFAPRGEAGDLVRMAAQLSIAPPDADAGEPPWPPGWHRR